MDQRSRHILRLIEEAKAELRCGRVAQLPVCARKEEEPPTDRIPEPRASCVQNPGPDDGPFAA
jgi:hypothetical protein